MHTIPGQIDPEKSLKDNSSSITSWGQIDPDELTVFNQSQKINEFDKKYFSIFAKMRTISGQIEPGKSFKGFSINPRKEMN